MPQAFVLSNPVSPSSIKMNLLASPSQEQWYDLLEEASPHICIFPGLQVHVQTARQNHCVFEIWCLTFHFFPPFEATVFKTNYRSKIKLVVRKHLWHQLWKTVQAIPSCDSLTVMEDALCFCDNNHSELPSLTQHHIKTTWQPFWIAFSKEHLRFKKKKLRWKKQPETLRRRKRKLPS